MIGRAPRVGAAVGGVLIAALVAAAWLARTGGSSTRITSSYACPEPVAVADAHQIDARIADLHLPASVEAADASHLRVTLAEDLAAEAIVRALFDSHRLEIRRVDEAAMRALATGTLPPGVTSTTSPRSEISAPTEGVLAALGAPAGTTIRVGCDERHACRAWTLGTIELGSEDVDDASASHDGDDATLAITLTSAAQLAFARLTTSAVGARLAFLVDDHVLMVPVVQDPITGGHVSITLGASDGGYPLAAATASALRLGPLACSRWSLE